MEIENNRILGIDPGPLQSAYCILENDIVSASEKEIISNKKLLEIISGMYWRKPLIAIELIQSYGMPVGRETFETCIWIGRYIEMATHHEMQYQLYARPSIKSAITGIARAKDADVRRALILRYGGTKKGEPLHGVKKDIWSALAVATYCADGAKLGVW